MEDIGKFSDKVTRARQRAETLWRSAAPPPEGLADELQVAWEELLVAEEELRQQNDDLIVAGQAVERERQRFVDLFESAPDGYVITNLSGVVCEANAAARGLLRVNARALTGKPLIVFVAPHEKRRFRSLLARLPQLRKVADWEIFMQPRQAAVVPVSLTATLVEGACDIRWTLRDVTERRQMQDERQAWTEELERCVALRTAQLEARTAELAAAVLREHSLRLRAEDSERAKEAFLATISHELRTPLTALLGWVYVLSRAPADPRDDARALGAIERATRVQVKLIDDILDASRMMAGKLILDRTGCDLAEIVGGVAAALLPYAEQKGLTLACLGCLEPLPVWADGDRLQQVVWNLVSNAVKFTPRGGRVEIALERAPGRAAVVVADTGVGIEPDFLPHVFERFRQADSSTTRSYGGLGLGLTIARHLIEAHGGALEARSPGRGRGATFRLTLPVIPPSEVPVLAEAPAVAASPELLRVLIVEDDEDTRAMLAATLEPLGFVTRVAATVDEALSMMAMERPHVVLSDIGMPEKDGYALARAVREWPPGAGIPVVALSGYSGPEPRRRAREAGFHDLIVKPVLPDELQRVLREAVGAKAQEAR